MLDPNEYVLQRVHHTQVRPDGSLFRGAYTPTPEDTDGLSFYREESAGGVTPEQVLTCARKPASQYIVVKIKVEDIQAHGLSVVLAETDRELPGHCVIPEFTHAAYQDRGQKPRWVEIQESLCESSEPV